MASLTNLKLKYPFKSFYKVPNLVPPWNKEQKNLFFNYLLKKSLDCDIRFEDAIRKEIKTTLHFILVDSGRNALRILLKNLSLSKNSEIIVPVLCCPVVPNVIKECGLKVSFADIGSDLCLTVKSIKDAMTSATKGVVLIHSGGAAAIEYNRIVEFCKINGLYLIDDAAQGWGNKIDDSWLGTRGSSGIISFGLGKSTFGVGGGMLFSDTSKIKCIQERKVYKWPFLLSFYFRYLKRNYTAPLFMYTDKLIKCDTDSSIMQISYLDMVMQHSIFKELTSLIEKRTEISLTIMSILKHPYIFFPQVSNKHIWTKLIIKLPERIKIHLQKFLYMHRIESEDYFQPFYLSRYWRENAKFQKSNYPLTGSVYKELLILPNSPGLTTDQLDYLYQILKNFKKRYL